MSAHPGGLELKFWFDPTDSLWHGKVSTQTFSGATLEDMMKAGQAIFPLLNQSGFFSDACWAVGISNK